MKTMTAFWRYDWQRNASRHLALAVLAVVIPWIMEGSNAAMSAGQLWAPVLGVVSGTLMIVALPLLFLGNLTEVGRVASPQEFRHFVHTLPVDRGEWALAKLGVALTFVVFIPMLVLIVMVPAAKFAFGAHISLLPNLGFFDFCCVLLVGAIWTMLWAALLPHRWGLLGISVFVVGECLARGVTSLEPLRNGVASGVAKTLLARSLDMGLLVLLAALLGAAFVRYHQRRRRGWALLAAFLALGGIDGARALIWWWVCTN